MNREIVGIHAPHGQTDAARLQRALGEGTTLFEDGPMVIAFTGPRPASMSTSSGPLCLLDGEVHNRARLCEELGAPPDASAELTVARAYAQWGESALERLRGDFSLFLWDSELQRGLLARDPLGIRPLFVHDVADRLVYASEVGVLLRALPRRPDPDPAAIVHWLCRSGPGRGRTLYRGIRPLGPGSLLRLEGSRLAERRYWTGDGSRLRISEEEAGERVRAAIARAIRVRTEGQPLVGIELSGGLDSSSIAAIAARLPAAGRPRLRAYSAVFPDHPDADESHLVDATVTKLGLPSVRMAVRRCSALAPALRYMDTWQVPLAPANHFVWAELLRRAARDGVTTTLNGAGGDELFGASGYLVADRVLRGRFVSAWRTGARISGMGEDPPRRVVAQAMKHFGVRGALPHKVHLAAWRARAVHRHAPPHLSTDSAELFVESLDPYPWKALPGPRWRAKLVDLLTDGADTLGVHDYLRRRATDAGLETRQPILDLDLVELVLALPPELAYDPVVTRRVQRQAAGELVPSVVRRRPRKNYFDSVLTDALLGSDQQALRSCLDPRSCEVNAYLRPGYVGTELLGRSPEAYPGGAHMWSKDAWRLLSLECWLRAQGDPAFAASAAERFRLEEPDCAFAA